MKKLLTVVLFLLLSATLVFADGPGGPPKLPGKPVKPAISGVILLADGPGGPPAKLPTGKPGKPTISGVEV